MLKPVPDRQRQASISIRYVTLGTQTFVAAVVGRAAVVMTPDEVEKASVDLWSAAYHARRDTAVNQTVYELNQKKVRKPQRSRKGKIPMTD